MRTKRWFWVLSVWTLMLGVSVAQPPLLVLTNGDVNGDNLVDDVDLLAVIFRMGDSCPQGCAGDLNGDLTVDDTDLLIVNFQMGAQGAPAFAGQVSAPQGVFRVLLRLQLGDWVGASQSVKVQLKPVGAENDASVPIYERPAFQEGAPCPAEFSNSLTMEGCSKQVSSQARAVSHRCASAPCAVLARASVHHPTVQV